MKVHLSGEQEAFLLERIRSGKAARKSPMSDTMKRFGFLENSGLASLAGYWAVGQYKNMPAISVADESVWRADADRALVIAESFMIGQRGAFSSDFRISIRSLMEMYAKVVARANSVMKHTFWDRELDAQADGLGVDRREIRAIQNGALKKASLEPTLDGSPLESICVPVAQAYLEDPQAPYFQASATLRFSFADSGWERDAWVKLSPEKRREVIRVSVQNGESKEPKKIVDVKTRNLIQKAKEAFPSSLLTSGRY